MPKFVAMQGRQTKFTDQVIDDPIVARQIILANIVAMSGNMSKVAKMMGISRRTLYRYVKRLDMGGALEQVRNA